MRRKKYGMKKYQQDVKDGEGGGGRGVGVLNQWLIPHKPI